MPQYFNSRSATPWKTARSIYAEGGRVEAKEGKWIQKANIKKGALRKQLGIKKGKKISLSQLKSAITFLRGINGQEYWGIGMGISALSYIIVSLIGKKEPYNMDKLLNRGKYAISGEVEIINDIPDRGWKMLGIGKEFTKTDKLIYVVNYLWTGIWTLTFIIGTIYNLSHDVSNDAWMTFWKYYLVIQIGMALISIVWFTWGGYRDLRVMLKKLKYDERDHSDDGWVTENS